MNLRPKLRASAQISRQYYRGERWYVVRDPAGNQYHRLSDAAYRFVGLLDGTRTVGEAWDLVGGQLADDAPTQPEVIQILSQLYAANLVETDITPDAQVLLKRQTKQRTRKFQQRLMNTLFPRIPLWDPDRFLRRWMPAVGPLMSKFGALLWLVVVIAAVAFVAPHWQELWSQGMDTLLSPRNWVYLWACFVGIKIIHEMGHGFACRRFGGECHEMGIMFLVLIPTPYVDASAAWGFPNKWARVFVGAGGMVVEIFVAALAAFVWVLTKDGSYQLVAQLAYNVMLIASVTTVIFNANPLLRYDGYYILSDLLEIPNLQKKSSEYTLGIIKRHVFRVKPNQPLPPPGQRVWLFNYATLSTAYRMFISIAILMMVTYSLPEEARLLGVFMATIFMVTFFGVPLFKLLKYLLVEPELHRKRTWAWTFTLAVTSIILGLLGLIPAPMSVYVEGVVEPEQKVTINVRSPGFVQEIKIFDGTWVKAGDVILVLEDARLVAEIRSTEALIQRSQAILRQAAASDQNLRRVVEANLVALNEKLDIELKRRDDLTIRAPIDGQLISPWIEELPGRFLQRGQEVAQVAITDRLLIKAAVAQKDSALLAEAVYKAQKLAAETGDPSKANLYTEVRFASRPSQTVHSAGASYILGGTDRVHPLLTIPAGGEIATNSKDSTGQTTAEQVFELRLTVDNPGSVILPGQRAYIRVPMESRPLLWQWTNKLLQLIQRHKHQGSPFGMPGMTR